MIYDILLKFAVIVSKANGRRVFCKHKERNIDFDIQPICVDSVIGKNRVNESGEESYGMLYYAEIRKFTGELHSEMERIIISDEMPEKWTYLLIQPFLIEECCRRIQKLNA